MRPARDKILESLDHMDEAECRSVLKLMGQEPDPRASCQPQFSYKQELVRILYMKELGQYIRGESDGDHN